VCAACEWDYTALGSPCCDTAWTTYSLNCKTLQDSYGWDCAGCSCPGDPSPPQSPPSPPQSPQPPHLPPSPPSPPPSLPPASPPGVCGDGTALDAVTRKCEVSLDEFTEVVGGKCAVACSDNRRLEEAQEEGAQEAAAASIVDGLLARHPDFVAKLRRANLDEEAIKIMLELGQDFRLPALA